MGRHELEDNNDDGNDADKGQMEAVDNIGRKTAASRARARSLHRPLSGIRLPLRPSHIFSEAEEREVTVLASELEAASEEVEVEECQRFFSPCRWINSPFMFLRVSVEGW